MYGSYVCCESGYLLLLFLLLLLGLFVGALLARRMGKRFRKADLEEDKKEEAMMTKGVTIVVHEFVPNEIQSPSSYLLANVSLYSLCVTLHCIAYFGKGNIFVNPVVSMLYYSKNCCIKHG